jgi:hypothetical protein
MHMVMVVAVLKFAAVMSSALFAGAALYINIAEHPARMTLETRVAASQWGPSYRRATGLQAPLAVVSLLCGATLWLMGAGVAWLVAALLVGAVIPFTLGVIMPTNHKLLAAGRDLSSAETRELLVRWGRLHAFRTALSMAGTMIYVWQLLGA